jgi:hypothetical protein
MERFIKLSEPLLTVGEDYSQRDGAPKISKLLSKLDYNNMMLNYPTVKFDTDKLPPILNALETDNGGQKLVLEVAVCLPRKSLQSC